MVLRLWQSDTTIESMTTITLKLPEALERRLVSISRKRGRSKSQIVREALEQALTNNVSVREQPSCYDLVSDLISPCQGPRDLSTNPKYLKGYGK